MTTPTAKPQKVIAYIWNAAFLRTTPPIVHDDLWNEIWGNLRQPIDDVVLHVKNNVSDTIRTQLRKGQ